jgi:hypothetical protein
MKMCRWEGGELQMPQRDVKGEWQVKMDEWEER